MSPQSPRSTPTQARALPLALALAFVVIGGVNGDGDLNGDGDWSLVFEDTFSGSVLNRSSWRVANNMTHGSQEWELYLEDDVYVQNGNLVIRTQARDVQYGSKPYHFTSGWVDTLGLVELSYGKFEASIRLPEELPGVWPAYWLVDDNKHCWPVGGEIDILEAVGSFRDDSAFGQVHKKPPPPTRAAA